MQFWGCAWHFWDASENEHKLRKCDIIFRSIRYKNDPCGHCMVMVDITNNFQQYSTKDIIWMWQVYYPQDSSTSRKGKVLSINKLEPELFHHGSVDDNCSRNNNNKVDNNDDIKDEEYNSKISSFIGTNLNNNSKKTQK